MFSSYKHTQKKQMNTVSEFDRELEDFLLQHLLEQMDIPTITSYHQKKQSINFPLKSNQVIPKRQTIRSSSKMEDRKHTVLPVLNHNTDSTRSVKRVDSMHNRCLSLPVIIL
jgi:hypothetical protein